MAEAFHAVQVTPHVYWVGAIDWQLADFHGYATPRGSTYNAFLILGEKIALVDTVKAGYTDEMMARIASVIDPKRIEVLVSNHSEMDHTGALPEVLRCIQPSTIVASPKGVQAIERHFHNPDLVVQEVKEGDTLSLGNLELRFILSTMVHWPDSMFSYLNEDGVLFSNDAFGMHLASSERFTDQVDPWIVHQETMSYYANILWPTSKAVAAVLKKMEGLNLPLTVVAPDHGPLWRTRDEIQRVLDWYRGWTTGVRDPRKAVVLFDTMWGSTGAMARAIAEGLGEGGMTVRVFPQQKTDRSEVAAELLEASAFVVGSPSLNGGLFPTVADALTYLKGLRPAKPTLVGGAFGSFGWSAAAQKQLVEWLSGMGVEVVEEGRTVQYVPDGNDLAGMREYGLAIANRALGKNPDL